MSSLGTTPAHLSEEEMMAYVSHVYAHLASLPLLSPEEVRLFLRSCREDYADLLRTGTEREKILRDLDECVEAAAHFEARDMPRAVQKARLRAQAGREALML